MLCEFSQITLETRLFQIGFVINVTHDALGMKSAKGTVQAHHFFSGGVEEYNCRCELNVEISGERAGRCLSPAGCGDGLLRPHINLDRAHFFRLIPDNVMGKYFLMQRVALSAVRLLKIDRKCLALVGGKISGCCFKKGLRVELGIGVLGFKAGEIRAEVARVVGIASSPFECPPEWVGGVIAIQP